VSIEADVAEYVTRILTEGMPNPRVTVLFTAAPDGTMSRIHVRVDLFPKAPDAPGVVVPMRR
jgi:hypothetical protein